MASPAPRRTVEPAGPFPRPDGTDTAACVERFSSIRVRFVAGEQQNFKITYPQDVYVADRFARTAPQGRED